MGNGECPAPPPSATFLRGERLLAVSPMATTRAVLFDFGGTLYDYADLQSGDAESLIELGRAAGIDADPPAIFRAHREALKKVFYGYLPRRYYLHRDLFRDAAATMVQSFGLEPRDADLDAYRASQWIGIAATSSCATAYTTR